MLSPVSLVGQWRDIERSLPHEWSAVRLAFTVDNKGALDRAAGMLAPLGPSLSIGEVRFTSTRSDGALAEVLQRLDDARVRGSLHARSTELEPAPALEPHTLAESWRRALADLPPDWSDVHAEIELRSTDHLERAALLMAPLNPARYGVPAGFRFRCARSFGYGASAEMVSRCLERCDAERITGRVRILRALSDSRAVATQGPVWYVGGKAV